MKYYKYIWVLFLCLQINAVAQPDLQKLKVGEPAPSLRPMKWIKGTPITEFERGHIYILEFGATWCVPCIKMIPELTSLAEQYKGKATVVSLFVMEAITDNDMQSENPAYLKRVEKLITRQGDKVKYNIAVDDPKKTLETTWLKAAQINGIPVTFVINQKGNIEWIGSNPGQLKKVVAQLANNHPSDDKSPTISTEKNKPELHDELKLIAEQNNENLLLFSLLTTYTNTQQKAVNNPYVENYEWLSTDSDSANSIGKLQFVGCSLRQLYYIAYGDTLWNYPLSRIPSKGIFHDTTKAKHYRRSYGKYWYRPILEMKDTSAFETSKGKIENKYNYTLSLSPGKATSQKLQQLMQDDLNKIFGYSVSIEKRKMPCWKLQASPENQLKLKTKTPGQKYREFIDSEGNFHVRNAEVRDLVFQLEIRYGRKTEELIYSETFQPPFIDETGISGQIDYDVDMEVLEKLAMEKESGIKFTFEQYRQVLHEMGIELIKSDKVMNVVVINDPTKE